MTARARTGAKTGTKTGTKTDTKTGTKTGAKSGAKTGAKAGAKGDTTMAAGRETLGFEAEVSRLLHMMVHSVYSNRDVFLRELVSNASDACERLRHEILAGGEGTPPAAQITIETDKKERRLTVTDNGIGMSREELISNLGTIARSGTRAFIERLASEDGGAAGNELIGQFGVGFYSAFMVADRVEVTSRRAGSEEVWCWRSDGGGSFTIEPVKEEFTGSGTRVTLHLKEDAADHAEPETIERIIRTYSANVPVPIVLKTAGEGGEKRLGEGGALWRRPKSEITSEEYTEFYRLVSGQFDEPALTIHYRAEGRQEYSVLLFVPSVKPFDLFDPARVSRIRLYVKRVFITDDADLLPGWLRFVRGIIDSEDLPLNISREMLQKDPILGAITTAITKRVLSELTKLAEKESERFEKLWEAFGSVLKEGLYEDPEWRDGLFALARFRSTAGEGWRSLKDYVADFRENQTSIYYLLADSREAAAASPHLEGFRSRGLEVLLLTDPVDAFWVTSALGYDGKPFQSITQGAADLDRFPRLDGKEDSTGKPKSEIAALAAFVKQTLGDKVADVRLSARLADSPVCLVAPDFGPDRRLEKLLRQQGGTGGGGAPILELNPDHALIKALSERLKAGDGERAGLEDAAWLLYGQARILDGDGPEDPADFGARLARVMAGGMG